MEFRIILRRESRSHRAMAEHAAQSCTLIIEFPMLDEVLYE